MASSSRPHRRAKASHSYKEAPSDDDDFSIPPTEAGRSRSLALRRTSRAQERANAKERAEAVQLERALRESLAGDSADSRRTSRAGSELNRSTNDISDSDDEVANTVQSNSVAFQCLLDVASEAQNPKLPAHANDEQAASEVVAMHPLEANEISAGTASKLNDSNLVSGSALDAQKNEANGARVASLAVSETMQESTKVNVEADDDWSYDEGEGDEDSESEEDFSGDDSDDSVCERRQPKKPKENHSVTGKQCGIDRQTLQVKKARSSRPPSRARNPLSENTCSTLPVNRGSAVGTVNVAQGKENASKSCCSNKDTTAKMGITKSAAKSNNGAKEMMIETISIKKSSGAQKVFCKPSKAPFLENSCESPGSRLFQLQSPTVPHRRVIGLSKRFRPPPLHPYLSKSIG